MFLGHTFNEHGFVEVRLKTRDQLMSEGWAIEITSSGERLLGTGLTVSESLMGYLGGTIDGEYVYEEAILSTCGHIHSSMCEEVLNPPTVEEPAFLSINEFKYYKNLTIKVRVKTEEQFLSDGWVWSTISGGLEWPNRDRFTDHTTAVTSYFGDEVEVVVNNRYLQLPGYKLNFSDVDEIIETGDFSFSGLRSGEIVEVELKDWPTLMSEGWAEGPGHIENTINGINCNRRVMRELNNTHTANIRSVLGNEMVLDFGHTALTIHKTLIKRFIHNMGNVVQRKKSKPVNKKVDRKIVLPDSGKRATFTATGGLRLDSKTLSRKDVLFLLSELAIEHEYLEVV